MKSNNLFLAILFCLLLVTSCSKDSEVQSSFPFDLTHTHLEETIVNFPQRTILKVVPEKEVESNTYSFQYELLSGEGTFVDEDEIPLAPKKFHAITGLSKTMYFVATKAGEAKVKITVQDSYKLSETIELTYDVSQNPFSIDFSTPTPETSINAKARVALSINNQGVDGITYERKFSITEGEGLLYPIGADQSIALESFTAIENGLHEFDVVFTATGTAKLQVVVKDSNGQEFTETLEFNVSNNPFSINFTAASNEASINAKTRVALTINNQGVDDITYERKFSITEGQGLLYPKGSNQNITLESFKAIENGLHEFDVVFTATGIAKLQVVVKDSNGQEFTETLEFDVSNNPYSLNFNASFTETYLQKPTPIELIVNNLGSDNTITYERKFSFTQGTGSIVFQNSNQSIALDDFAPIATGSSKFDVKFSSVGAATLEVTVKDSNGFTQSKSINFTVEDIEVSFSASLQSQEIFAEQANKVFFELAEINGFGGSYELKYVINSGNVSISYNNISLPPDTYRDVNIGNFFYDLATVSPGEVSITFTLKNQDGAEIEETVSFFVKEHELDFSFDVAMTESYTTQPVPMQFAISELPWASAPYTFKFYSNGVSTVTYNNVEYEPGQAIAIDNPNFDLEYTGLSLGEHNVSFLIENDRGITLSKPWTIEVLAPNFEYSAQSNYPFYSYSANQFGSSVSHAFLTHSIQPFGDDQTFKIKYEVVEGPSEIEIGFAADLVIPLAENALYDIAPGQTQWQFVAKVQPNVSVTIKFTVVSNTLVEHESTIQFLPAN
ncbi:TraQ conjugal transfer family protein [Flagellimonas sp.]|uniref:TraQ conjugal transfer family protein n=1 Tax=Flagellimonas sp. TaxID=2058762 RepID=UPI003BAD0446